MNNTKEITDEILKIGHELDLAVLAHYQGGSDFISHIEKIEEIIGKHLSDPYKAEAINEQH